MDGLSVKKIIFLDTNVILHNAFSILYFQDELDVFKAFFAAKAHHRILSSTFFLRKKYPKKQVVLVSKDVNLRLKAKFPGLQSQDDCTDKIEELDKLSRGKRLLENMGVESIDRMKGQLLDGPVWLEKGERSEWAKRASNRLWDQEG